MSALRLTLACWDYDRTAALRSGAVVPAGVELEYHALPPEETFHRTLGAHEFDVSELSVAGYVRGKLAGTLPYTALPIFPSRCFRHSAMFVRADSSLSDPLDLVGRRVGVPVEHMTAAVWYRGTLRSEHGVDWRDIDWVAPPGDFVAQLGEMGRSKDDPNAALGQMLLDGEIDALLTVWTPSGARERPARIRTLLADPRAAEQQFFERTRIFPIMHTVVVRDALLEEHPWLALRLFDAFTESKRRALTRLWEINALAVMLPWLVQEIEDTVARMGIDFWPYGMADNRRVLNTALDHLLEQELIDRRPQLDDLFLSLDHAPQEINT